MQYIHKKEVVEPNKRHVRSKGTITAKRIIAHQLSVGNSNHLFIYIQNGHNRNNSIIYCCQLTLPIKRLKLTLPITRLKLTLPIIKLKH